MPDYPWEKLLGRMKVAGGRHSSEEDKNDGRVVGKCWAPREKLHGIEVTHPQNYKCFGLQILMMQDRPLQTMIRPHNFHNDHNGVGVWDKQH